MVIISVSVNEEILRQIDTIKKAFGFSGRSEVIRAGIRLLDMDRREKEKLEGSVDCVLLVGHNEASEQVITERKHQFNDIIRTHIHSKLGKDRCLEVFLLSGEAERISEVTKLFQRDDRIDQVRLFSA